MENDDKSIQKAIESLVLLSSTTGKQLEKRAFKALKVLKAEKGFLICSYTVPIEASDKDGYWHVGAIATLADGVCATAVYSVDGHIISTVDFGISFYSRVKLHEEVEVEAKVVGVRGRMSSVVVQIKRKNNGELVALGKQWMAKAAWIPKNNNDKIRVSKNSKL